MKFSLVTILTLSSASAFHQPLAFRPQSATHVTIALRQSSATDQDEATAAAESRNTKKEERLRMMKSSQFHRRGFKEVREQVEDRMAGEYESPLVKELRSSNYVMEKDGVKVYLAKVRSLWHLS